MPNENTEETPPAPSVETPPTNAPSVKPSKLEKAIADDIAQIRKHIGLDGAPPAITAPPVIEEIVEDKGHADECPCAYCYMTREDSD